MNGVFKIDAAAQLAGKLSMMNPDGGKVSTGHNHGGTEMSKSDKYAGHNMANMDLTHESFTVSGNCEMCKTTIEAAVKSLAGIDVANWNIETKELHVSFNDEKSSLSEIHKAIAKSGYDTKLETATKDAYDNLPACCQYTRAAEFTTQANVQHEMFKVSGNCGMCEETIETAVKALDGVNEADWSQETKMIHVSFNSDKVQLGEIHKAIAKAGYDTELERADDEVYNGLPGCCQYTRE